MIIRTEGYSGKYRIVSLAFDSFVKDDLLKNNLDVLFISENSMKLFPDNILISNNIEIIEKAYKAHNYDVYELWEDGKLSEYYNDSSSENYFFVTAKCNSNCVMCPSPDASRKNGGNTNVDKLIEIARHIPTDTPHLTITGGEPFMVGKDLFRFIEFLRKRFECTDFLFLTNGRIFAVESYVQKLVETIPNNSIVAVPIHGSNADIHDSITKAEGSFVQTVRGVKRLLAKGIRVELRVVISKLNVDDIDKIAKLISSELQGIEYVSIMAMEMTGNARVNKEKVWIPYRIAAKAAEKAIIILLKSGIDVRIYNFPLCSVEKEYWTICKKRISPGKIRYVEKCDQCVMKNSCGGVFAGTIDMEKGELKEII